MRPRAGFREQATADSEKPATVAVNICVCTAARDTIPGLRATMIGTASLKSWETMELFTDSLIATARTVAELVRAMGPEYGWDASDGRLPSVV
jgi:hypothetical protein